ncbi:hypothetical protein T265_14378, partial [Opisthorchis viverrini]
MPSQILKRQSCTDCKTGYWNTRENYYEHTSLPLKSTVIFLLQIGITVYLSQIGSFVPAEEATIGPMDAIYAITCTETLAALDRSSDSLSLNLVLVALRFSTERSLILLDEFAHSIGKASVCVTEASALTTAIIEHLLKSSNPHVVATTHDYDMLNLLKHQADIKF